MHSYDKYANAMLEVPHLANHEKIINYYTEADNEYEGWSKDFNMHFGYYHFGDNPFNLEQMLKNMNERVFQELDLKDDTSNHLIDLGCGLGATARQLAYQPSIDAITGITLVAPQVIDAKNLAASENTNCTLNFTLQDYHCTQFANESFEGAYAIESSCHSNETNKQQLIKEAYRILKPGGRFVIADGFVKGNKPLNRFLKYCYKKVCDCWALGEFPYIEQVEKQMQEQGFKNIKIEDTSWATAPSVVFIPFVATEYFFKRIFRKNSQQKWNHLLAPVFLIPLALSKLRFGYYIVSGEK